MLQRFQFYAPKHRRGDILEALLIFARPKIFHFDSSRNINFQLVRLYQADAFRLAKTLHRKLELGISNSRYVQILETLRTMALLALFGGNVVCSALRVKLPKRANVPDTRSVHQYRFFRVDSW